VTDAVTREQASGTVTEMQHHEGVIREGLTSPTCASSTSTPRRRVEPLPYARGIWDAPRMNAAVLFADMSGFTALTEAHGDDGAADLATRFASLAGEVLHGDARIVKTLGDAVMIVASSPEHAARTALDLVASADLEPSFPELRAGLHHGPVVERAGDVFGATVNVAARVAAQARAGEVLCTADVAAAIERLSWIALEPRGPSRLKNVSSPVELFCVCDRFRVTPDGAIDPVCRMRVAPTDAGAVAVDRGGRRYLFCSDACARAFDAHTS
jgi:class 3 adenylate cyclase/YHS domain-containing protein